MGQFYGIAPTAPQGAQQERGPDSHGGTVTRPGAFCILRGMRGQATVVFALLCACAPSTEGHFIQTEGAQSLLVLTQSEGAVQQVFGIELSDASSEVWFPEPEASTEVLRYGCSLAALGLAAGPMAVVPQGRALPRSSMATVPELTVQADLPSCRPITWTTTVLPDAVQWLSTHGEQVLVGHAQAGVSWVHPGTPPHTQRGPDSLYGLGVGGSVTLFLSGGGTQTLVKDGPDGPRVQLEAGLWDRWLAGTSTGSQGWLLSDRGAVLTLSEGRVRVQDHLPSTDLGQTVQVAAQDGTAWAVSPSLAEVLSLDERTASVPAPPGRVAAVAVVQGELLVGTETGEVLVWRAETWTLLAALGQEVLRMTPSGSSLLLLTAEAQVAVLDVQEVLVCFRTQIEAAVGQHHSGTPGSLHLAPAQGPARLWSASLVDGTACPNVDPLSP